jgi:hypothetical protein
MKQLAFALFCAVAQAQQPNSSRVSSGQPENHRATPIGERVTKLENQVAGLLELIDVLHDGLGKQIDSTDKFLLSQLDNFERQLELASGSVGFLDASTPHNYIDLRASNGLPLFVAIESVEPYLDGFKLNVKLGNPNYATIYGCVLKIGPAKTDKSPKKAVSVNLSETLRAGSWTYADFVLPGTTPAQLKNLEISISVSTVGLK